MGNIFTTKQLPLSLIEDKELNLSTRKYCIVLGSSPTIFHIIKRKDLEKYKTPLVIENRRMKVIVNELCVFYSPAMSNINIYGDVYLDEKLFMTRVNVRALYDIHSSLSEPVRYDSEPVRMIRLKGSRARSEARLKGSRPERLAPEAKHA
jgi:hypothetical protein